MYVLHEQNPANSYYTITNEKITTVISRVADSAIFASPPVVNI